MSTLSSVLNTALTAMSANQFGLAVASNNVANANNPDYARQRLLTEPAGPDGGQWSIGMGVRVVGVQALRDQLVEVRWRQALSGQSHADTLSSRLSDIEGQFNDSGGTGLLQKITDFFNSFQALSQDPASLPFREQVRSSANALIQGIHDRDQYLAQTKANADRAISSDVDQVNSLASQIADLTRQIKNEEAGTTANDLRDRRGALVKELSKYVTVNELDSGDYQITTQDNHLLVFNDTTKPLTAADVTSSIGRSLQAEVEVLDSYVPKYSAALDQLAYEISQQVNSVHSAAYDLNGNTGINFFNPLASASGAARLISLSSDVAGDTTKIAASTNPTGNDNGAAIALGNLIHANVFSGGSVTDQYGNLVFSIGSESATAQSNQNEEQALVTQLDNRRQSISGVSIDEETAQIAQFQRAYQASAQLIQTVDNLLDITLGLVGGTTIG